VGTGTHRYHGHQVQGHAEIVALPEAMDGLVDSYRRVAGEHDDWDDYRAATAGAAGAAPDRVGSSRP
jgi:hypothetical protein